MLIALVGFRKQYECQNSTQSIQAGHTHRNIVNILDIFVSETINSHLVTLTANK